MQRTSQGFQDFYLRVLPAESSGGRPAELLYPEQFFTGRRGYLGKRASLRASWHRRKVEPRSDCIRLACLQVAHNPAARLVRSPEEHITLSIAIDIQESKIEQGKRGSLRTETASFTRSAPSSINP